MNELSNRNNTAAERAAHQQAVQSGAVERYLLNDMSSAERLEFEEHYFACPICAEEVAAGQEFIEGVRAMHSHGSSNRVETPLPEKAPCWKRFTCRF